MTGAGWLAGRQAMRGRRGWWDGREGERSGGGGVSAMSRRRDGIPITHFGKVDSKF